MLSIKGIKCNSLYNPIGIDTENPLFSFYIESTNKNVLLTNYRIIVTSSNDIALDLDNVLWDSGKLNSDNSISIEYAGEKLISCTRYYYKICVWDNHGETSGFSENLFFETGKMNDKWEASFIGPFDDLNDEISHRPFLFRKVINLSKEIKSARIYSSALGIYKNHINGEIIDSSYFTPGWTVHEKRLQYQVYDVTDKLKIGHNVIGMSLTNGWYNRFTKWLDWSPQDKWRNRICCIMELQIEYIDGTREVVNTDESWKYGFGPITMTDFYDGEHYDARLENDWCSNPKFDYLEWKTPAKDLYKTSVLVSTLNEPVCIIQEIKPVGKITTPKGETLLDMGQNMVGFMRFSASGNSGDKVVLLHGEVLDSDGNFYNDNLRTAKARIEYTLNGSGIEIFSPMFTFHGFRYVKIVEYPGDIDITNFTGCVIHSNIQKTGSFECSNPMLNQLQSNINWGLKGNFIDLPTDCPQRDERWGWTGDAQVFISTACHLYDTKAFYTKWLYDLAADQTPDGAVSNSVPNFLFEKDGSITTSAAWGDAACICPWTIYQYYGDIAILQNQYVSMKKWVLYMKNSCSQGYLWDKTPQLGDWVALDAQEGSYTGSTSTVYIATAFFAYSTSILVKAAKLLGKFEDYEEFKTLYSNICNDFQNEFLDANNEITQKTQTAMLLALNFELIPDNAKKTVTKQLVNLIRERNTHLSTGFVGTPYLLNTLSNNGELKLAYELLLKQDYPSWLYSITKGATTIWEHWDGIKEDGSFWDTNMNSYNHYAYGSVGRWMYDTISGLRLDNENPGYKKFIIEPKFGGNLTYAKVSLQTVHGRIRFDWTKSNNKIQYNLHVPCNTSATVYFPNGSHTHAGSGEYQFDFPLTD